MNETLIKMLAKSHSKQASKAVEAMQSLNHVYTDGPDERYAFIRRYGRDVQKFISSAYRREDNLKANLKANEKHKTNFYPGISPLTFVPFTELVPVWWYWGNREPFAPDCFGYARLSDLISINDSYYNIGQEKDVPRTGYTTVFDNEHQTGRLYFIRDGLQFDVITKDPRLSTGWGMQRSNSIFPCNKPTHYTLNKGKIILLN